MKAEIKTELLNLSGCTNMFLLFSAPAGKLERNILKVLTKRKTYIAGAEPKFSLFLNDKPAPVVEHKPEQEQTWEEKRPETCICGTRFKDDKVLRRHQEKCSIIALKENYYKRIDNALGIEKNEGKDKKKSKGRKLKAKKSKRSGRIYT